MAIQFKNLVDVFEQRTGAVATDAYTLTVSTEQTSGASPNPGTGGLKVQYYSVSSGTTHGFGLVAGTSSSDFLTSGPMHFYTNSDLDTKSATGFAMVLDTSQNLGIGVTSITAGNRLEVAGGAVGVDDYIVHNGDTDTKFGFVANDNFAITTAGVERVRVTSNGEVGIGTTSPTAGVELSIQGSSPQIDFINSSSTDVHASIEAESDTGTGGKLIFKTKRNGNTPTDKLVIRQDGAIQQGNSSATGQYAAAFGQNNTANSLEAFATGENTTASGRQSFSGGFNTTASGDGSFAHGASTLAQGINSFAAGAETEATGTGAAAFNNQTNATGINSFAIGGNTTASGEASFASGVSTLSQGIGSVSSGLSTNAAANGTHASGVASTATGLFSSAQGDSCLAQGQASIAMGYIAEARGNFGSAAIGFNVDANGQSSLAVNQQNVAQGVNSIAGGFQTNIDSNESMGMGFHCKSQASTLVQDNQFLFGRYLNAPQSAPAVQAGQSQFIVGRHNAYLSQQHTAFAVGNGSGIGTESNAMTVLYNGRVGIGTTAPTSTLHVIGDITSSSGALFGGNTQVQGSLQVGDNVGSATAASAGSIRYRTTSNSSHVDMVMQTGASSYAWVNIVTNTW